ncbi:hypothetical protein D9C73_021848 [Collichthys lucidus]|uniref:Uncharacterized protein n=1 Tax=Collichthys lucidus TaxID=240159 RepID=A0A4U5VHE8_COLLU|nr:hypothetical protein D9C73_021848 [Collichthys lucidus]
MDHSVKCGGWSDTKDATEEIQKICDEVHVGCDDYLHIRVFQSLDEKSVVTRVEEGHHKCDPLIPK